MCNIFSHFAVFTSTGLQISVPFVSYLVGQKSAGTNLRMLTVKNREYYNPWVCQLNMVKPQNGD
jgi:hypothetical protein